jgi:hypothetical protein
MHLAGALHLDDAAESHFTLLSPEHRPQAPGKRAWNDGKVILVFHNHHLHI